MEFREIRASERELIEQIVKLEEEVFGENGGVDEWILKPFVRYGKVLVILEKGEVHGVAELMRDWTNELVYIYGFAIKKSSHGKGLGSTLLEKTLEKLKKEDIKEVTLTTDEKNIYAISLYEKFGFEKIEILRDEYGKGIDRLNMSLKLKV